METGGIADVLARHTPSLMAVPGVVGVAQGEIQGHPCVRVLVARLTPELVGRIPSTLDGYPVLVDETGPIEAIDAS